MTKAEMINFEAVEDLGYENVKVIVKGIKFDGEYDVDIYYARHYHVWEIVEREHITCKRVSTINKKLAAKGFTCKVA